MLTIRRLNSQADGFWQDFDRMLDANLEGAGDVNATVQGIIDRVRLEGDSALLDYTRQFDRLELTTASELEIPKAELYQALEEIDPAQRDALEQAQKRIYHYAEKQAMQSWQYTDDMGNVLGQKNYSSGSCWYLCARWYGCLSFFGADECGAGQGCWR